MMLHKDFLILFVKSLINKKAGQGCEHMVDIISNEGYTRTDGVKKKDWLYNKIGEY